ncbi:MAG: hypothetical protein OXI72_20645, partial [Gemmatimonadota bacterium]|nr:hypothetical protein [Gemmatimonadota bacterium]
RRETDAVRTAYAPLAHLGERFFCAPSTEFFRKCKKREQIYENFTTVGQLAGRFIDAVSAVLGTG